jgi:hypothetical protein
MIVFFDSGVIYSLVNTSKVKEVVDCQEWFYGLLSRGVLFVSSAICEYEVKLVIATNNVKHLSRFANAEIWQNITF